MKKVVLLICSIAFSFMIVSCSKTPEEKGDSKYISQIKDWHNKRIENLKKEDGWLNLVGLFALKQGENKFGSGKNNNIVFPERKAPDYLGTFTLKDSVVTIKIENGADVTCDGKTVTSMDLKNDMQGTPTVLSYGSLRWFIIYRSGDYYVRLRDVDAPLVKSFKGIDTYPVNSDWRLEAKLMPFNPPKKVSIANILGKVEEDISPGDLVFTKDGKEYSLQALLEDDHYFIIFADETSGEETYGAGRFVYAAKVDSTGKTIIDFNKAFNPPCVFTKYATCPFPPKQNHLKMKVTAGELMFHGGAHE